MVSIVSPGCSASSMVFKHVLEGFGLSSAYQETYTAFVRKSHAQYLGDSSQSFIKSDIHGLSNVPIRPLDKVVYIYSHPLNIVAGFAFKQKNDPGSWENGNPHYVNYLECDIGVSFWDNYLDEDVLNLERHLDEWWRPHNFNLFCVKYEFLHQCEEELLSFLNEGSPVKCHLKLPPPRPRATDWNQDPNKEKMLLTYASLVKKFHDKPPFEKFS